MQRRGRATLRTATVVAGAMPLPRPVLAADSEFGSLTCPAGQVVWVTERTGAGTTTVSFGGGGRHILKQEWSTTRPARPAVHQLVRDERGAMDHAATGVARRP